MSERKTKIAASSDRTTQKDENASSECGDMGLCNKTNEKQITLQQQNK